MEVAKKYFKGSMSPKNAFDTIKYVNEFNKEHPFYFKPERDHNIYWSPRSRKNTFSGTTL